MPTISGLYVYPIKSCAGIALSEARLSLHGIEYDRNWMVTDATGAMITQRSHAQLALVTVGFDEHELVICAPHMNELRTPLAVSALADAPAMSSTIWDDTVQGIDTGAQTAAWFSAFLGTPARLVRFDPAVQRVASRRWTGEFTALTQFADGFPLLVIGQASLADLNERLGSKGAPSIPMNRFRPNLVLTGLDAYEEDYVVSMTIQTARAAVELRIVKPCSRCPIPTIDQALGAPDPLHPNEPLDTMSTYRADPRLGGALTFGQNAIVAAGTGAVLALGQEIDAQLGFGD